MDVLRGKGVVAVALLCRGGPPLLGELCTSGVLQRVERAGREQSVYVSAATASLRGEVAAAMPALLAEVRWGWEFCTRGQAEAGMRSCNTSAGVR